MVSVSLAHILVLTKNSGDWTCLPVSKSKVNSCFILQKYYETFGVGSAAITENSQDITRPNRGVIISVVIGSAGQPP